MREIEKEFMNIIRYAGASEKQMRKFVEMNIMDCPEDVFMKYLKNDVMDIMGVSEKRREEIFTSPFMFFNGLFKRQMTYLWGENVYNPSWRRERFLWKFMRIIMYPEIEEIRKAKRRCGDGQKMHEILKAILEMNDTELSDFLKHIDEYEYLVCMDMGCGSTSAAFIHKKKD